MKRETDYAFVVSYHTVKYKFGNDLQKLRDHSLKNGLPGTSKFYRVAIDGSWHRFELVHEKELKK